MIERLPLYVYAVFILTTLASVWLFSRSTPDNKVTAILLSLWLVLHGCLSLSGFYLKINNREVPFQMAVLMIPIALTIVTLFITPPGRRYLDGFDLRKLTWLHVIRIPVELVIWWWWIYKLVPEGMTFKGANPDICSGISALLIVWLLNRKKGINNKLLLAWNAGCLLLVLNILTRGILSLPTAFQKYGASQPNTAILYFPFIWLPACIVPLVILSHLVAIRKLVK